MESGRVCEKCFPTSGRVLEAGCVGEQRSRTNGGIAATGGVLKQGTKAIGRVTIADRVATECGKAGCGVTSARGVAKERVKTNGRIRNPARKILERAISLSCVEARIASIRRGDYRSQSGRKRKAH